MNNLTRFDNDAIEIFIDPQGKSFASLNGAARMAQKPFISIQRFIAATKIDVINAEIDTATGKKNSYTAI